MSTYTYTNVVSQIQPLVKNAPVSSIQIVTADIVNSIVWAAYPWRWSLGSITPVALVDGTQDYTGIPTDYFRLVRARITRTDTTPDQYNEIIVVRNLVPELTKAGFDSLSSVAVDGATSKFRLNCAASVPTGITLQIDAEYQKLVTKVASMSTVIVIPDQYMNVVAEGMLWWFYRLLGDTREGGLMTDKRGNSHYSGQMGVFYDALIFMREAEEWGAGDSVFPSDPLGAYRSSTPNLFGN